MSETCLVDPTATKAGTASVAKEKPASERERKERKPREPIENFSCTDEGNAELLAELYGKELRYDHKQGRWLIWKRRWSEDKQGSIHHFAIRAARYRAKFAYTINDPEKAEVTFKWAKGSENAYRVAKVLEFAQKQPRISDSGDGWDADPWLFGAANGVVDLRTGKLRLEQHEDRITKHSTVRFDPAARCPRFERFLREIFNEDAALVDYVRRAIGYSLTGLVTEQCLFCCYGTGGNGKGILFETLRGLFGDYAVNLPFSALEVKTRNSIDLVALAGARFATASETNEDVRLNEARIKGITGGDAITDRRLYQHPFTFQPTHKLWLAFNHKPIITDDSEGMWRRMRLIPFERQFKGKQEDKNLLETLAAEAEGILALAVAGCVSWQRDGLGMPPAVASATAAYREESDHVGQFIEDC